MQLRGEGYRFRLARKVKIFRYGADADGLGGQEA
jgi:hypothetical protein